MVASVGVKSADEVCRGFRFSNNRNESLSILCIPFICYSEPDNTYAEWARWSQPV